ncbi:MAG: hypothetical protein KatS3mg049_0393 [Caldilinea sp.]|jgi:hypothetical protein|nr:MAG: hypothetical protein KatS3mg049_0393 [Caldilinea sp.]
MKDKATAGSDAKAFLARDGVDLLGSGEGQSCSGLRWKQAYTIQTGICSSPHPLPFVIVVCFSSLQRFRRHYPPARLYSSGDRPVSRRNIRLK